MGGAGEPSQVVGQSILLWECTKEGNKVCWCHRGASPDDELRKVYQFLGPLGPAAVSMWRLGKFFGPVY